MASVQVIICEKCKGKLFCLMVMPDRTRVVCANSKCGYVPLDLTGSEQVFKRLPRAVVNGETSGSTSPIITTA